MKVIIDSENESLPNGERASLEQQTYAIAPVPPRTVNMPEVSQPVTPLAGIQRITRILPGIRPTPESHSTLEASVEPGKSFLLREDEIPYESKRKIEVIKNTMLSTFCCQRYLQTHQ